MTAIKTMVSHQLKVLIGNGATPEVFAEDCLINTSRGINHQSDQQEFAVPDCDDPSLPAWRTLFKDNNRSDIEGAGMLHTTSTETWWNFFRLDITKNVRVILNGVTNAFGGGYWWGAFKLTDFNVTGSAPRDLVTVQVTLKSHGEVQWTDNP